MDSMTSFLDSVSNSTIFKRRGHRRSRLSSSEPAFFMKAALYDNHLVVVVRSERAQRLHQVYARSTYGSWGSHQDQPYKLRPLRAAHQPPNAY